MSAVALHVALFLFLVALAILGLLAADPDRRIDDGTAEIDDDPEQVVDLRERLRPYVHGDDQ